MNKGRDNYLKAQRSYDAMEPDDCPECPECGEEFNGCECEYCGFTYEYDPGPAEETYED